MIDFNLVDANGSVSVRAFANKSAATRYANKNGLTIATSVGALALIADTDVATLDTDDVDSVLASLDATDATATETVTLRDTALSFDTATVTAAVDALRDSFARRDTFEASNGLSLTADSSYVRERNRMLKNEIAVSRFFLALGVTASDVIERKVSSNAMFNAKALKKVTELAQYAVGVGHRLEKVSRAFIACALIATDRGHTDITNDVNRKFLNGSDFSALIKDAELIDYLRDQRHVAMTSGAETQSSQARNVLDVLGLGAIKSVQKNRDAIALNTSHGFFAMFRGDFLK
ncbi:MAG TPA: hypothetical protein H9899_06990 [Candidatus Sphingomonas excrementigallinarum]|nr:hypothetical protein [Candidatus Sphingomonas excrementigallinarum]